MGKAKKVVFKKLATKISKGMDKASKLAVPAAYAAKYNKEITAAAKFIQKNTKGGGDGNTLENLKKAGKGAAKVAKFLANNSDTLAKGAKTALKDPRVQKMILDQTLGLGLKYGEKYADKKLGKYKAYRIAKGGVNLLYDVGTGNLGGALNEATNIYGEADPNKKRVAKVKGAVGGINQMVNSAMAGDLAGAYGGALQTYAVADPNKKRVGKVMNINNKYIAPAYGLYQSANELYNQGSSAADIGTRSKMDDLNSKIKNQKVNSALTAGSNIGQHKANLIVAHDNQDYGGVAKHAKLLHLEAKNASKMQTGGSGSSGASHIIVPIGPGTVKPITMAPIGTSSAKPGSKPILVGGGGKKPKTTM